MSARNRTPRQAKRAYENAQRRHQAKVQRQTVTQAEALTDNTLTAELGLPADLPESTRAILGHTMTLSRLGPKTPKRTDYINRGSTP